MNTCPLQTVPDSRNLPKTLALDKNRIQSYFLRKIFGFLESGKTRGIYIVIKPHHAGLKDGIIAGNPFLTSKKATNEYETMGIYKGGVNYSNSCVKSIPGNIPPFCIFPIDLFYIWYWIRILQPETQLPANYQNTGCTKKSPRQSIFSLLYLSLFCVCFTGASSAALLNVGSLPTLGRKKRKERKNDDIPKTNWRIILLICGHKYIYRKIEGRSLSGGKLAIPLRTGRGQGPSLLLFTYKICVSFSSIFVSRVFLPWFLAKWADRTRRASHERIRQDWKKRISDQNVSRFMAVLDGQAIHKI